MKQCPFCAEKIQEAAIKCKHCGEMLDGSLKDTEKINSVEMIEREKGRK